MENPSFPQKCNQLDIKTIHLSPSHRVNISINDPFFISKGKDITFHEQKMKPCPKNSNYFIAAPRIIMHYPTSI